MRCPNCGHEQRYTTGMSCAKCKYQYIFHPKKDQITDNKMNNMLDKISNQNSYYFTEWQLILLIARFFHNRNVPKYAVYIILAVIGFILSFFLSGFFKILAQTAFVISIGMIFYYLSQRSKIPIKPGVNISQIKKLIERYQKQYPEKFQYMIIEGGRLTNGALEKADITSFAPEKILIVEDKTTVDLLIYNRLHLQNKTAIVSIDGYPENVYHATKDFVRNQPNIPVYLLHNASGKNINYLATFKANSAWQHLHKHAQDLGLNWSDINKTSKELPFISNDKIYFNKFNRHFATQQRAFVPVDFAQPAALVTGLGAALVAGAITIEYLIEADASSDAQDYG